MLEQVLERIAVALEKIAEEKKIVAPAQAQAPVVTKQDNVFAAQNLQNPLRAPAQTPAAPPVQQPQATTTTAAAPPVQEPKAPSYTADQLGSMCRQLADQGKMPAIQAMFQSFGISALDQLPQDKYSDFANQLILQGAKL